MGRRRRTRTTSRHRANPKPVADYRGGKESALKALVGLVMRETRGRANPQLAEQLLREQLDSGA